MRHLKPLLFVALTALFLDACTKTQQTPTAAVTTTTVAASQSDYVITPEGPVLQANVHLIEPGFRVALQNGHVFKIHMATGKIAEDFGVFSPLNRNALPPKISRSLLKEQDVSGIGVPDADNYIAWGTWVAAAGTSINSFSTSYTVPPAPSLSGDNQLLYIWNGLADQGQDNVMQPVLQWGVNERFGGAYWTITNWYVWGGGAAYATPETHIASGTPLQGVLTYTGTLADGSLNYTSVFTGHPTSAMNITQGNTYNNYNAAGTIALPSIPAEVTAYEALEATHGLTAYGVNQSNDYPTSNEVSMTNISLQVNNAAPAISWTAHVGPYALFGERAIPISNSNPNGEVDIYFRPPVPPPAPVITSLGERPSGGAGAIGGVIVYFTVTPVPYFPASAISSYTARVTNSRLGSYVVIPNIYGGSPAFVNGPSGTVKGDNLSVVIAAVYTEGSNTYTSNYSNTMSITF